MKATRKKAGAKTSRRRVARGGARPGSTSDALAALEEALAQSEERHRRLVESSSIGIYTTDAQGQVTYVNPRVAELTGHSREYLLREGWHRILHGERRDAVIREWREAIERGAPFEVETEIRRPDGEIVWLVGGSRPEFDAHGRLTGYVGTVRDITEIRKAEIALKTSEERFRAMVESCPAAVFLVDPNGDVTYNNPAGLKMLGQDAGQAYGSGWAAALHPDSRAEGERQWMEAMRSGKPWSGTGRFQHRDGRVVWCDVRTAPVRVDNRLIGYVCTAVDVSEQRRAAKDLRESEARYRQLFDQNPNLMCVYDRETLQFIDVNDAMLRHYGYERGEFLSLNLRNIRPPEDLHRMYAALEQTGWTADPESPMTMFGVYRHCKKNGEIIDVEVRSRPTQFAGRPVVLALLTDVTERRVFEERLRLDAAAIESTRDGVLIAKLDGTIVSVNRAFRQSVGYEEEELVGQTPKLLQSGRHGVDFYAAMWRDILGVGHWQGEIWNRRKDGEIFPVWVSISAVYGDLGKPTHYVAVYTDITKLKQSEEELEQLAHFDPLTELPNRLLLQSRLEHAVDQARRRERLVGVLFIDLDDFKKVNDSLGHVVGDELLVAVAGRLGGRVRGEDTLARLGGDEFVVLLEQLTRPEEAATVARDLLVALSTPFSLSSGHELYVQASIGISIFPVDASSTAELLRDADTAMYRAKDAGDGRFLYFTGDMSAQVLADLELESALRQALEKNQLALHYQAKVELATGRIFGAEALLRWRRDAEGFVSPARFIPVAEKTGLIIPIGRWVLETALAQARRWLDDGLPDVRVAVNVSALQFRAGELDETLQSLLRQYSLPARNVTLELTESLLMENPEETTKILRRLKRIGVMLSLDDFGTGFSSLTYLTRFPMDTLKIDASFVRGVGTDESAMTVISSIIELAHRMRMTAVAEGVETREQFLYMKQQGCDAIQGFLFGKPVPPDEFAKQLKRGKVKLPDG